MLKKVRMLTALGAISAGAALLVSTQPALGITASGGANSATADVVGVGSDTLQFAGDFLADGSPGNIGYNTAGNKYRLINYDSTGDAVGRALYNADGTQFYQDSPTSAVVLRSKQKPVELPDGSTAGIAALLADSPGSNTAYGGVANGSIQYARASRIIKSGEESSCALDSGCGQLHPIGLGTDPLGIAADQKDGTNAIALSAQQLAQIYECTSGYTTWNSANIGGTSTDTIIPVIPQSGSGTRNDFITAITAAGFNGTFGGCVKTAQEHDPQGILAQASPKDAIEPFSAARIALINSGYFVNAGEAQNLVALVTGSPTDSHPLFGFTRTMYVVLRQVDVTNTTPWQPGGTANWASSLFVGSNSFLAKATGQADVAAAGFTAEYVDCGAGDTGGSCASPS